MWFTSTHEQRIKIPSSLIVILTLTINLSFLVGLITKQEQLKRLANDDYARYIQLASEWNRYKQATMQALQ